MYSAVGHLIDTELCVDWSPALGAMEELACQHPVIECGPRNSTSVQELDQTFHGQCAMNEPGQLLDRAVQLAGTPDRLVKARSPARKASKHSPSSTRIEVTPSRAIASVFLSSSSKKSMQS